MLHEFLAQPAERAVFPRPWFVFTRQVKTACSRSGQETESRIEGLAELVQRREAVPEVIRIVQIESPAGAVTGTNVARAEGCPRTRKEVLVAEEFGGAPHCVESRQTVLSHPVRMAIGKDRSDAQSRVQIV